jgi:hypothetical protein
MGTMLESIEEYYRRNNIYSLSFHCQHLDECKNGNEHFVEAKGAFVGTEYEKGTLPRLLFLSLDPGCSKKNPEERTAESVRHKEEQEDDDNKLRKTHHWYRTHELALTLLKGIKPNLELQDTHLYFAHVNSVKCCVGNKNHKSAPRTLFRNCQKYIGGELDILEPDILVTQGKKAKEAIQQSYKITESLEDNICAHTKIFIGGKKVLWLPTSHPRNYGRFYKQKRECFDNWAKIVSEHYGTTFKYP